MNGPATGTTARGIAVERAVARRAFRQVRRAAVLWGVVFGGTVAATAVSYATNFPDAASRAQLVATTSGDRGLAMLLGPVAAVGTVGGYTVYKCYAFLTTIGAVWGLLAATRLLRGEEDAGRWQLQLAGGITARRATVAVLAALVAAVAVVFAGTTVLTVAAGRDRDVGFGIGSSVVHGLSIAVAPLTFAAVGALTAQLGRTRRLASGLGLAVLGASFVVRMLADAGTGSHWLLWCTPFGWSERMRPFTGDDLRPALLAVATTGALAALAVRLAGRRDAGSGAIATRDEAALRRFGLSSPLGLVVRLELPVLIGWCVGIAAAAFSFGLVAELVTGTVPASLGSTLDKFGVRGTLVRQYFGVAFLLLAVIVALVPASHVGAAAAEETSGRLAHVVAQPTRRHALLAARLLFGAAAVVVAAVLGGVFSWLGARSQGVDVGFGPLVGAGLDVAPSALVVLGFAALVLAIEPRAAATAVYAVVTASLIVDLVSSLVSGWHSLDRVSLFHYMALAPAQPVHATTVLLTLAVAVALGAAATALFRRRDLSTD